jgi:oxygen-dependent protoporphyrinogen oxidase
MSRTLAVIGGGISGLSAARRIAAVLNARSKPVRLVLAEARPRWGGLIESEWKEGALLEHGPDALSPSKPWPEDFWDSVRLRDEIVRGEGRSFRFPFLKRPFFSFRQGMCSLASALAQSLPPGCSRAAAAGLRKNSGGKWTVLFEDGTSLEADGVCLAVPAYAAADLLRTCAPRLADILGELRYRSLVSLYLGYRREDAAGSYGWRRIQGGVASPPKFAEHAPGDRALMRVLLRDREDEWSRFTDEEIAREAHERLARVLRLPERFDFYSVRRHVRKVPKYGPAHALWRVRVDRLTRDRRGLFLAGAAYRGVSVFSCMKSGERAAEEMLKSAGAAGS